MVGASIESDIRGAIDAGINQILYYPVAQDSQQSLFG
jgi:FMN phosphatase YigB (HAD superfamily)